VSYLLTYFLVTEFIDCEIKRYFIVLTYLLTLKIYGFYNFTLLERERILFTYLLTVLKIREIERHLHVLQLCVILKVKI